MSAEAKETVPAVKKHDRSGSGGGCTERKKEEEEDLGRADDGLFPLDADVEGRVSTTTLPNGDRYHGFLSDGRRHGRGRYVWHNGASSTDGEGGMYEGQWRRGVRDGVGCHEWKDGSRYAGEWRDGKPDGWGVYTWQKQRINYSKNNGKHDDTAGVDRRRYKGGFRGGERSGLGVMWRGVIGDGGSGGGGEAQKERVEGVHDEEGGSVEAGVWKAGALETPMPVTCGGGGTMTATMRAAVREAERAAVRAGDAARALSSILRKHESSSGGDDDGGGDDDDDHLTSWPWDETVANPVDDTSIERGGRGVEANVDARNDDGGVSIARGGGKYIRKGEGVEGDVAEESARTNKSVGGEETGENPEDARREGGGGGGGGFHFAGLGNGGGGGGGGLVGGVMPLDIDEWKGSAVLYVQRLGANIRRGVTKGVRELQTSDQVRGIRGFINKLGGGGGGGGGGGEGGGGTSVPSLHD